MIPTATLPGFVTIRAATDGLTGTTWADQATRVPARITGGSRQVRDDQGNNVTSNARLTLRPDVELTVGAQIVDEATNDTYTVLMVRPAMQLRRRWALLADLAGPR